MLRAILLIALAICWNAYSFAAELVSDPNDASSWKFEILQPAAGTLTAEQGGLRIDITSASNEPWHVQMYQEGKSPIKGHKYILRFSAKANEARPIIVLGQLQDDPWALVTDFTSVDIDREWKQHSIELTMTDARAQGVRLPVIQVGQRAGSVWFRDISVLEAGETPAASVRTSPANAVEHMKPTPITDNWQLDEQSTAKATLKKEEETLRIDITAASTERAHLQVFQHERDLAPGQKYVMKFIAKASEPRKVGLAVQVDQAPYAAILEEQVIEFSTRWQLYTLEFVAEKAVPMHTRMPVLALGGQPGTVWIRDVSVIGPAGSPSAPPK